MTAYDEERLGELLSALPPAPEAWVEAAKDAPFARRRLEEIVERAKADEYRRRVVADPKASSKRPTSSRTQRTSRSSASGWRARSGEFGPWFPRATISTSRSAILDRMAAEEPTPAGGSAAAIGVAMASALIAKVAEGLFGLARRAPSSRRPTT